MNTVDEIAFHEDCAVNVAELNTLYHMIGWDPTRKRNDRDTSAMLQASHYCVHASDTSDRLVGFARIAGDPYVAQVLDVITHPDFRRRGIATECMKRITAYLNESGYVSVTLLDDSGIPGFYDRFGFQSVKERPMSWQRTVEGTDSAP